MTLERSIAEIIATTPDDPKREGLRNTPIRFAKSFDALTSGYRADIRKIVGDGIFHEKSPGMIVVRSIEFYSLCEHHLLPFFGHAHVAYLPQGRVLGLSKIPRIVDVFARRLQLQERLTREIAEAIDTLIEPIGVAVIMEARHLCMMMRGVQKQSACTTTSSLHGTFLEDSKTREELLDLIQTKA